MASVQLRCKVFPGAFFLYLCKPRVSINGSPEQILTWGENTVPVPPGRYHLRVWFNYLTGATNTAQIVVDVAEGQAVPLVYKTRWLVFLPGKLEFVAAPYAASQQQMPPQQQMPQQQMPQQPMAPQQGAAPQQPQGAAGQAQQSTGTPQGWNADPTGRHQHRWWDGTAWTAAVADDGVTSQDPL